MMTFLGGRITINPEICNGKPTIRNTRIRVKTVLEFLGAGESHEEILNQYPTLEEADIRACLNFASELLDHEYGVQEIA